MSSACELPVPPMPADRRTDSSAEPAKEPPSLLACAACFAPPTTCEGKPAVIFFRVFAQGPLSATPSFAFLVVVTCISLTMVSQGRLGLPGLLGRQGSLRLKSLLIKNTQTEALVDQALVDQALDGLSGHGEIQPDLSSRLLQLGVNTQKKVISIGTTRRFQRSRAGAGLGSAVMAGLRHRFFEGGL